MNFRSKKYSLMALTVPFEEIRSNVNNLNLTLIQGALDSVTYVLQNSELKEPTLWSEKNSEYFTSNIEIASGRDNFLIYLKKKSDLGNYNLNDIIKLTEFVRNYYDRLKV
ncbi:hypothetical protein [Clostridium tunisiense]|uniref:hypothetical protein n=1 Tax=Clostridium tunisiense TaxID=219748 RepID=UPI000318C5C1|nr:hypothetical protein [Clostridium tunisiense]